MRIEIACLFLGHEWYGADFKCAGTCEENLHYRKCARCGAGMHFYEHELAA
jgi:hypothetical protein